MPPVKANIVSQQECPNAESMLSLVNAQKDQVIRFLNIVKIISPQLLGLDATQMENGNRNILQNCSLKNYWLICIMSSCIQIA